MLSRTCTNRLSGLARISGAFLLAAIAVSAASADTLVKIVSAGSQGGNDSLAWSQKGPDQTILPASFTATSALSKSVTVGLSGANSIISVVCTATPCSWTGGTGFAAGDSLLWTSDAGNGGTGPVTLNFGTNVSGAGALIQANSPGAFTAQIQLFNGATSLGSYTQASDTAGDALYLGAIDQTAANVTKVVFSLTTCATTCTDMAVDTVAINGTGSSSSASVSPNSLTFAPTTVGSTSASQTVTLTNTGSTALTITSIASSGSGASSFLIPTKTCGATLAVGANCTFAVAFKPTTTGALSAVILVTDSASGSPQQVNVSGTGQSSGSTITFSPTSVAFPATTVGSSSTAQTITLTNTGSTSVSLTSVASSGTNASSFIVANKTCTATLAAGTSCTFSATFKPTTTGALSGAALVTDSAPGSPQSVPLSGTGQSAGVSVSLTPGSMSFPTTTVGATSAPQTATLTNTGTTTINISSIAASGTNASSFLIPSNGCGSTLAAGANCTFTVAFKPTAAGALSGSIQVTDNATGSPQSISVSGTGQAAGATVTLTPGSLTFPTTKVGSTSASQTITLTNTGSTSVSLTSAVSSGTNASSFLVANQTCSRNLAAGASCTFGVTFKPTATGALTAAVLVTDSAAGSPQQVSLSGTGN